VTVVLASNASDIRLDIDGLLHAISQLPFIAFSIVYIVGVIVLAGLSETPLGRRWVFIDVGLCALFGKFLLFAFKGFILKDYNSGGFTVLSTKALSTLLTLHWIEIFAEWITYPIIVVSYFQSLLLVHLITSAGSLWYRHRASPISKSCPDAFR
jgi:hypothetical protein